ncbi:SIR2 family protein [Rhodococcus sp. BP-316]|uniref:SIR2 family protein n=1 Tax=Rhodococcus sp. BP-316 TaxID=2739445 RepID=UPI001C9AF342|nr:SIR2 family protein [Rhodococcus sp. BP-316]MBY6682326.1 SIR2 family protein [Rhodococcus sp. BP-316]
MLAAALPDVDYVLTTNYDDTWQDAYPNRKPIHWRRELAATVYDRSPREAVFHLHGHHDDSESIILSGQDYGRLGNKGVSLSVLQTILMGNSLCLIGCGAGTNDPTLGQLLDWLSSTQGSSPERHYLFLPDNEAELFDDKRDFDSRLTPIAYGPDHSALGPFLDGIFKAQPLGPQPEQAVELQAKSATRSVGIHSERKSGSNSDANQALASLLGIDSLPEGFATEVERELGSLRVLNDFQSNALYAGGKAASDRTSALFCAVTGTGKTTLARIAMNIAVANKRTAVALYPTKAIVRQEYENWTPWSDYWNQNRDQQFKIYAASRDFPDSDRPVARGQFDVAVAIYEKLGVYLVNGREPLSRTSLLVVDEFQTLADGSERASKLEAILTVVKMLPAEVRPALLGLSPSLGLSATSLLRKWWGIDSSALLSSNERPIPLDTFVVDSVGWVKQRDSHLLNIEGASPPAAEPYTEHGLTERAKLTDQTTSNIEKLGITQSLAATLVDLLLEQDDNQRIICFVATRRAASDLAIAIQKLILGRTFTPTKGSPWANGRYASPQPPKDSHERYSTLRNSDIPGKDYILRGLLHGVAPHSAEYAPSFRRILEDEFRSDTGLLRVLVATDTLAMGINLPADVVIATSISGYGGPDGSKVILSPENLDNKAGRAGRLGKSKSSRGSFYLLVPTLNDLRDVDTTQTEKNALIKAEYITSRFVRGLRKSITIRSNYRTPEQIAALALQVLSVDGYGRRPESFHSRIDEIRSALLLAAEDGVEVPPASSLIEELQARQLLHERADGKIAVTGLGHALAHSSLELGMASTLERVARFACANAGDIDLLWNTCRSRAIQGATRWISLPPVSARHLPSLKDSVIEIANAYCADTKDKRMISAQRISDGKAEFPSSLVESGSVVLSEELRNLLDSDGEHASDADVRALLRAVVAFEWSRGIKFSDIQRRLQQCIKSEEALRPREKEPRIKLHYSDVEQLCEQIAGVLRGAAEVAIGVDGASYTTRVLGLAAEVESGLPYWLDSVRRLRYDWLHRETLSFLWNSPPLEDSLSTLFDDVALVSHPGIPKGALEEAKRALAVREQEEVLSRSRVGRNWSHFSVPNGGGESFGDVSEGLYQSKHPAEYLQILDSLAEDMGVIVSDREGNEHFVESHWSVNSKAVDVCVPRLKNLTSAAVESVINNGKKLVLLAAYITPAALVSVRNATGARFVTAEQLLTSIAKASERIGEGYNADDLMELVSSLRGSGVESDSWYVTDRPLGGSPPFTGSLPNLDPALSLKGVDDDTSA